MTPILCFDLETIPDVAGLRRLDAFDATLDDAAGVAAAAAARRESHGSDFFPHHLQRIWIIGCVFRDHEGFRVRCLGVSMAHLMPKRQHDYAHFLKPSRNIPLSW